jgi:hypothetical protein
MFCDKLVELPESIPAMLSAQMLYHIGVRKLIVRGNPFDESLTSVVYQLFEDVAPSQVVVLASASLPNKTLNEMSELYRELVSKPVSRPWEIIQCNKEECGALIHDLQDPAYFEMKHML